MTRLPLFPCLFLFVMIALAGFLYVELPYSYHPSVQQAQNWILKGGVLLVLLLIPKDLVSMRGSLRLQGLEVLIRGFFRLVVLLTVVTLTQQIGDCILIWLPEVPSTLVVAGIGLVFVLGWAGIVYAIMAVLRFRRKRSPQVAQSNPESLSLSSKSRWIISCHEAGHLILHHALRGTPKGIKSVTKKKLHLLPIGATSQGYVRSLNPSSLVMNEDLAQWFMLMLLGGRTAEKLVFGQGTYGAGSDLERWHQIAQRLGKFDKFDVRKRLDMEEQLGAFL